METSTIYFTNEEKKRFFQKVKKKEKGCWKWLASCMGKNESGGFYFRGKMHYAARIAWMLENKKEIGRGLCVLHKCDNPNCVNPQHLFLGTILDNIRDRDAKGRTAKGKNNGRCKLSMGEVSEIRKLYSTGEYSQVSLAVKFKVKSPTITNIVNNKRRILKT